MATHDKLTMRSRVCLIAAGLLSSGMGNAAEIPATGQASCYNASGSTDCAADAGYPRQDASLGGALRYTRLDVAGNKTESGVSVWACLRDEANGLVWEAKTSEGVRAASHRYAWSSVDSATNGGDAGGTTETASCGDSLSGQSCTAEAYVATVNAAGLCGFNDWRMPTQRELLTLVHAGRTGPAIDVSAFPLTASGVYWAADTHAPIPAFAWGVHFGSGTANATYKTRFNHLRLVRGARF